MSSGEHPLLPAAERRGPLRVLPPDEPHRCAVRGHDGSRTQSHHDVHGASRRTSRIVSPDAPEGQTDLLRGGSARVREVHGGDPREERAGLGRKTAGLRRST